MDALRALLNGRGWNTQQVLIVGDSANLNGELALAYADHQLKRLRRGGSAAFGKSASRVGAHAD
jgi:hypothetical protein